MQLSRQVLNRLVVVIHLFLPHRLQLPVAELVLLDLLLLRLNSNFIQLLLLSHFGLLLLVLDMQVGLVRELLLNLVDHFDELVLLGRDLFDLVAHFLNFILINLVVTAFEVLILRADRLEFLLHLLKLIL